MVLIIIVERVLIVSFLEIMWYYIYYFNFFKSIYGDFKEYGKVWLFCKSGKIFCVVNVFDYVLKDDN